MQTAHTPFFVRSHVGLGMRPAPTLRRQIRTEQRLNPQLTDMLKKTGGHSVLDFSTG